MSKTCADSPRERPSIIILDESGQIGSQLEEMLRKDRVYQVELSCRPLSDLPKHGMHSSQLLVPVLPATLNNIDKLIPDLRALQKGPALLPIVRTESLNSMPDELFLCCGDFLVAPLREAEVRARIRRILPCGSTCEAQSVEAGAIEACGLAQLVGEDPAFGVVRRKISLAAQSEATVLLTGETGTGKEMCARALHYLSRRGPKPFLPVNCAAIPAELFENELYGHQKGAYTGAASVQYGLIEEARGGTLFLDEIEALGLANQAKILRFLQDQTYYSLGSAKLRQADVWIIASTNVDLAQRAQEGMFREDLFYRLAVITLSLPPLRERRTDVPILLSHFLKLYCAKYGRDAQLSSGAMETLCRYSWPGNVRELENLVRNIVVLGEARIIESSDLPIKAQAAQSDAGGSLRQSKARVVEQFESAYITRLLRACQGNVTRAASEARMERRAFGRLVKKYGIAKA